MLRFELKKVFSKTKNKVAVLVLLVILVLISALTINNVDYVDENGNHFSGLVAARNLREAKNQWAGYLTENTFQRVMKENKAINNSKEALSDDIVEQNKVYAKKQGMLGIIDVIDFAFSSYRDYDYYAVDRVSEEDAKTIYERRISNLKAWLASGEEKFTLKEQNFLIQQYENLKTPFYYEYVDGWSVLLQNMSTFMLMLALVIGFLVSGIFSEEFQLKADAIFFSTKSGRSKGTLAKLGSGLVIITLFYVVFLFLYTSIVLGVLGADGANCPIQLDMWRSVYNITFSQAYWMIAIGGYIGTLFAGILAMLASAIARSTATAIIVPFVVLCAFPFLSRIISLPELCSFFPNQLLEIYIDIKESALVQVGGEVTTTAAVIVPVYGVLCLILQPVLYGTYKKATL